MADHMWLLEKRGLYYRPNGAGYTGIKDHAGRYTEADACSHMVGGSGVSRIREDHAPEFSKACFEDLARKHLADQRDRLEAANEKLRAALEPFAEIARRLGWDKLPDDDMELGDHVVEAPAEDISPTATYCLMVGAFREAAKLTNG